MPLRSLLLPLLLAGCASHAASDAGGAVTPGQPFGMVPGQSVQLPSGDGLRYVGVSNDSRCPPGVQCIRAGDATVEFQFGPRSGAPTQVSLNTARQPATASIGTWQLQLVSLAFGETPKATVQVDPAR